jgi:uncharacterized integral membrane protein
MKPRTVGYLIALIIIVVFLLANWHVMMSSMELNFLVARVNAPLIVLIVLVCAAILLVTFIAYALNRRSWALERRSMLAQMEQLRSLANEAEHSRLQELRGMLEGELATIRTRLDQLVAGKSR